MADRRPPHPPTSPPPRRPLAPRDRRRARRAARKAAAPVLRARPSPVDVPFLFGVLVLFCGGLVMLLSASMYAGLTQTQVEDPLFFFLRQVLFAVVGIAAATYVAVFNLRVLDRRWVGWAFYGLSLVLLLAVLAVGRVVGGARRWFSFGGFQLQPTEVCKILLIVCLAIYYSHLDRRRAEGRLERRTPFGTVAYGVWAEFLAPLALLLPAIALIAMEPHFSGIAILLLTAVSMILMSGARPRSIALGFLAVAVLVGVVVLLAVAFLPALLPVLPASLQKYANLTYVENRLAIFFHPETVSADLKLQMLQAIQALGAGGLTGVGFGMGRQKFGYLPMSYNDYIFAIIGEELGLIGALAVLGLFLFLLFRGLRIARRSGTTFGYLLAGGSTVLLVVQALLHIGVSTNSIPPTGISLPFFSYGGSSNLFFLAAVGIVLSVSRMPRPDNAAPAAAPTKPPRPAAPVRAPDAARRTEGRP